MKYSKKDLNLRICDSSEIFKNIAKTNMNLTKTNTNYFDKHQISSYFSKSFNLSTCKKVRNKSTKAAFKFCLSNIGSNYQNKMHNYQKMRLNDKIMNKKFKSTDTINKKDNDFLNLKNNANFSGKTGIVKQRLNYNNALKNVNLNRSCDLITIKQLRKANTDAPLDYKSKDQMFE